MSTIVVTGGVGYIGSHIVKALAAKGYQVISIDKKRPLGFSGSSVRECTLDICNIESLTQVVERFAPIDCVIHCAGELGIKRSYGEIACFYAQNVYATECLLNVMVKCGVRKILYSSSASVYPHSVVPLRESCVLQPESMSPYSYGKYMCEIKLRLMADLMGIDYVAFRYFNVVGFDSKCAHSAEQYLRIPNIIPLLIRSAKAGVTFHVNGNDYDTPDGTCVRDYVDVEELARLHLLAYEAICSPKWDRKNNGIYNVGSGNGISVEELVRIFEAATMQRLSKDYLPRRAGDAPYLCADISRVQSTFLWTPKCDLYDLFSRLWQLCTKPPSAEHSP